MTHPDELRKQIEALLPPGKTYDEAIEETRAMLARASESELEEVDLVWRGKRARELTLDGWCHFYWCMFRREYPRAHYPIAKTLIEAIDTGRAKMVQAWRGMGKSTDLVLFVAWLVGVRPSGSTAIIRINDTKAQLTGDLIAEMIEMHRGWKAAFPNVIPDKSVGWSSEKGYNVQDTNVTGLPGSKEYAQGYSKWRQMCLADHPTESSLMSAGIESGLVIGLHPTNGMYFDDLHDEKNTRSAAEMQKVVDILENNIIPTWFTPKGKPILACVCTPWDSKRDAYHSLLMTGLFDLTRIPIYTEEPEGAEFVPLGKRVKLTWPEAFPMERVEEIFKASRERFFRMYLLDDEAAKELLYDFGRFPSKEIQWNSWTITTGTDPTGSVSGVSKGKGKSHYAFAHILETPYNNLVIGGGYVKKVPSDVGEKALANFSRTHPTLKAVSIESNLAGTARSARDAITMGFVTRNVGLKVHFHNVSELGHGSKLARQFKFLENLFANRLLLVAEGETGDPDMDEFLRLVVSALTRYPNFEDDEPEADVMDAICMAVLDIPRIWLQVHTNVATPAQMETQIGIRAPLSPIKQLGSYSYFKGN